MLGALYAGGTVVLARRRAPTSAFPLIERERVTITGARAAARAGLARRGRRRRRTICPACEVLQVGGAKLTPEVARRVRPALGRDAAAGVRHGRGLVNYTRLDDPDDVIVTTQGRPISPDDEILIVDDDGSAVPAGRSRATC